MSQFFLRKRIQGFQNRTRFMVQDLAYKESWIEGALSLLPWSKS